MKGESMAILAVILLLAFLVEGLVEYFFGTLFDQVAGLRQWRWLMLYLAAGVGVFGCLYYRFDLIHLRAEFLDVPGGLQVSTLGMVLTGLAVGRGANYLHDLVGRFFLREKGTQSGGLGEG